LAMLELAVSGKSRLSINCPLLGISCPVRSLPSLLFRMAFDAQTGRFVLVP
jgi:hypothetical protein